jgi:hypothetical protein
MGLLPAFLADSSLPFTLETSQPIGFGHQFRSAPTQTKYEN